MNRDFHLDGHRRPIKFRWLIFPLLHRLQCGGYQQRVATQGARLHHVSVLVDHGVDYHRPPDACLPCECRIFGLNGIGLMRCFEVGADAHNSPRRGLLRKWDRHGGPGATNNSAQ
jgi:hypothetical protein